MSQLNKKKGLTFTPVPVANRSDDNVKPLTFQITTLGK